MNENIKEIAEKYAWIICKEFFGKTAQELASYQKWKNTIEDALVEYGKKQRMEVEHLNKKIVHLENELGDAHIQIGFLNLEIEKLRGVNDPIR